MNRSISLATILALGLCTPAFAQTAPATTAPPATATGAGSAPSSTSGSSMSSGPSAGGLQLGDGQGMSTTTTSTMAVQFMTVSPTDNVTSRLIGVDVYNNQNEKVGDIEDFVIADGKTISGVIIGVGGFLGMGERYVAVAPSNLVLRRENNNVWRARLNTSKEDLSKAPTFDYSRTKPN